MGLRSSLQAAEDRCGALEEQLRQLQASAAAAAHAGSAASPAGGAPASAGLLLEGQLSAEFFAARTAVQGSFTVL